MKYIIIQIYNYNYLDTAVKIVPRVSLKQLLPRTQ